MPTDTTTTDTTTAATTAIPSVEVLFNEALAGFMPAILPSYEANVASYATNPAFAAFVNELYLSDPLGAKSKNMAAISIGGPGCLPGLSPEAIALAKKHGLIAVKAEAKPKHWLAVLLGELMPVGYQAMDLYLRQHAEVYPKGDAIPDGLSLGELIALSGKPNPGASCDIKIQGWVLEEVKANRAGTGQNTVRTACAPGTAGSKLVEATLFLGFRNDLIRPKPIKEEEE